MYISKSKRISDLCSKIDKINYELGKRNNEIHDYKMLFDTCNYYMDIEKYRIVRLEYDKDGFPVAVMEQRYNNAIDIQIYGSYMRRTGCSQGGRPLMKCETRDDNSIKIIDITMDDSYESKGYGTLLMEQLMRIVQKEGYRTVCGSLSQEDAKTQEQREKRNHFYKNFGFIVKDDESGEGRIFLQIAERTE